MAATVKELQDKLLALNTAEQPFKVTTSGSQVIATWNLVDAKWITLFGEAGMKKNYRLTLTLNEAKQEAELLEEEGDVDWQAGVPHTSFKVSKQSGEFLYNKQVGGGYGLSTDLKVGELYKFDFDIKKIKGPILEVLQANGWKKKASANTKIGMIFAMIGLGGAILAIIVLAIIYMTGGQLHTSFSSGSDTSTDTSY